MNISNIFLKAVAIASTIGITIFWSKDYVADGDSRQVIFLIAFWAFVMTMSVLSIMFQEKLRITKESIFLIIFTISLLALWMKSDLPEAFVFFAVITGFCVLLISGLGINFMSSLAGKLTLGKRSFFTMFVMLYIVWFFVRFFYASKAAFSDGVENMLFSLVTTPVFLYISVETILLPLFVLNFMENPKKKVAFVVTLLFYLVASASVSAQLSGKLKKSMDPCYQVIQGKGPIWGIKDKSVCMAYDENAFGYQYIATLPRADVSTFRELSDGYFADKNDIYYGSQKLGNVDRNNFRVLDYDCGTDDIYFFKGAEMTKLNCVSY